MSPLLDHVQQSELALLFYWHDTDESLVEDSSFRQFCDDLCGLLAAWRWDVDLLGELHITIFQGIECFVGSHPNMCSRVIPYQPLGCKDVTCMDKVSILFLEAISATRTLSSDVLTTPTSLL